MGDLIPITMNGTTVWIHRPPRQCRNGHPFRPGDISTYGEGWWRCWCSGEGDGHHEFTCKACGDIVLVPPCTARSAT